MGLYVLGLDDILPAESRSPYVYLSQREYVVNPTTGQYEDVTPYPSDNSTESPLESLKELTERLKQRNDQQGSQSVTSHRFENQYTSYNFANNDADDRSSSSGGPSNIQDVLGHRQGGYMTTTPGYTTTEAGPAPSYDSVTYQSPQFSYEVPSNYFPDNNYDWPSTYTGVPYGPPHGPTGLVAPFISGVGHLTSSVKQVQAQLGEQKAKTAYQVAEVVKGTGYAVNNAILNKGALAQQVIGQTIQTAGDALKTKGYTAQKIISNTGHLATGAIQSVGNIGSSLLRTKGELASAVLKTGAAVGTTVLGTASNALAGGTALVKAKGDAASNIIVKGGKIASGVIGSKGRLISSVINAKGQFVAQIVEAKGRAAASLLETSGQKLTQLAEAIKSATSQKYPQPGWGQGWGSSPQENFQPPPAGGSHSEQNVQLHTEKETVPVVSNHQHAHQYQTQGDYQDSYYDPRDYHGSGSNVQRREQRRRRQENSARAEQRRRQQKVESDDDQEEFQNEYSSYYQPHHYSSPSAHQQFDREHQEYDWEQ